MLFMLPASIAPGGTSIVVTPLVSLQGNMQERCEKARISSVQWKSNRPHDSASIVFVTPESAMTKGFAGFIIRLQEMHQLDRIVVDECHTILDGTPKFRPKLRQLGELGLKGVQMVYLTATLPPRDEEEFYRLTHFKGARPSVP
jgi:superfamily II DNA helicase RecQ